MSRVIEALLGIIEIMLNNPASILIMLGLVAILIGWTYGEVWIVAIGFFMSIVGIIGSVGKAK